MARPQLLATAGAASERMSAQASRDTAPELAIRRLLHAKGLRYRVHRRPTAALRREADILFGPSRVAVFVDGCFWHGCPVHRTSPKRNAEFWAQKIERNVKRDRETDEHLASEGWLVIRVWEHETPEIAAQRISNAVLERRRQ